MLKTQQRAHSLISTAMDSHSDPQAKLLEMETTIRDLLEEESNLRADLEECKRKIFEQQPYAQVSGGTLQADYAALQRGIDEWVYDALADAEEGSFMPFYIEKFRQDRVNSPVHKYLRRGDQARYNPFLLGNFGSSDFLVVSIVIQWILDAYIFDRPFPIGLSIQEEKFIDFVQDGMRSLTPTRGSTEV